MICFLVHASHYRIQWVLRLGLVLLTGATASAQTLLSGAEPAPESDPDNAGQPATAQDLKALTDPTILKRSVWLETEWNKYDGGIDGVEETLGGLWAWGLSSHLDLGLRLKIPYEWRTARGSTQNGLGDLKPAGGTVFRLSPSWRVGIALELRMPTAADHLGDRNWRLQEHVGTAWDATRWLTLGSYFEYNESLAEVENAPPQNYLEAFFPVTFLLPHHWAATAQYEVKAYFVNRTDQIQSAKLQITKQLNKPPLGFALSVKRPFDGGPKEFQVNFVVTYFFR